MLVFKESPSSKTQSRDFGLDCTATGGKTPKIACEQHLCSHPKKWRLLDTVESQKRMLWLSSKAAKPEPQQVPEEHKALIAPSFNIQFSKLASPSSHCQMLESRVP
ncbi:hypothetical protein L3Y34_013834 [Caenorhabditis briggsae]|uniref:Uncharacterized protein n=1 Tax=Caenorhabditis briggsae TaxID=6238 RepID=A0AAE9CXI7_CAEBR|nr:hypothetical protein L3Y34_013834 [Caenorhabditis briggsae]